MEILIQRFNYMYTCGSLQQEMHVELWTITDFTSLQVVDVILISGKNYL